MPRGLAGPREGGGFPERVRSAVKTKVGRGRADGIIWRAKVKGKELSLSIGASVRTGRFRGLVKSQNAGALDS